jgi:hypothetical protein
VWDWWWWETARKKARNLFVRCEMSPMYPKQVLEHTSALKKDAIDFQF